MDNFEKLAEELVLRLDGQVKTLTEEVKGLGAELSKFKEIEKLAFDMLRSGQVAAESIESVITDLSTKSTEELELIKRARSFYKDSETFSTFKLSSQNSSNEYGSAADSYWSRLLDN